MILNNLIGRAGSISALTTALIGAIAASACNAPARASASGGRVAEITGDFLPDGFCRVSTDGVPLYSASEKARTIYLRDRAMNMAPAGFEVHEIWCAPASAGEPMLPDQPGDRAFFINVYAPSGTLARARDYIVKRGLPSANGADSGALRANLSLFGPGVDSAHNGSRTARAGAPPGLSYLAGTDGVVRLTHVDSNHVTGTFRVHAVPESSM